LVCWGIRCTQKCNCGFAANVDVCICVDGCTQSYSTLCGWNYFGGIFFEASEMYVWSELLVTDIFAECKRRNLTIENRIRSP
jgi:hypothetical protein